MANDIQLPSRFTPAEAMVISDFRNPDRFVRYIKEGKINYHVDDGEVYFTEKDIIDIVCYSWDEEDRPHKLEILEEYCDIRSKNEWERIQSKVSEHDELKDRVHEAIFGHESNKKEDGSDFCKVCGKDDVFSKKLCEKHYHKIRYHYDEVNEATIRQYQHEHSSQSSWHAKHDKCKDCGSTERPHHAKGYCKRCYHRNYKSNT